MNVQGVENTRLKAENEKFEADIKRQQEIEDAALLLKGDEEKAFLDTIKRAQAAEAELEEVKAQLKPF